MTIHDDIDVNERFEHRLGQVEGQIPDPPPIATLSGANQLRVTAVRQPAGRRPAAAVALVVLVVAVVLVGAPLALRTGQRPAASGSVAQPTPVTVPSAVPTDVGFVDHALAALDLATVVHGLPGGSACGVDRIPPTSGSRRDGEGRLVGWDSESTWIVTCPHAVGDTTLGFLLADALRAEITRLGGSIIGEGGWTGDASTDFAPAGKTLQLLGDATTGVARVTTLDANASVLRIVVSLDLLLRDRTS